MIEINSLKVSPANIKSGIDNEVTFSWDASIDHDDDNPIQIELTIEDDNPVFFLDVHNQKVKTVTWETSDTQKTKKTFTETLYLVVSPKTDEAGTTKVFMSATDNKGNDSDDDCLITYQ